MKKKIVAIGGGENGRLLENGIYTSYETGSIDKEIIRLTEKEKPNFLFINHAMKSLEIQDSYYQTMKKIYGEKFNCNCMDLKSNELFDVKKVKEKLDWADIIYEGGGDTRIMIALWKKTGFDKLLYQAWNKGKVICGISAGAVCWFKSCNSYNEINNTFEKIEGLVWINLHLTPHCDEKGRYASSKKQLKESSLIGVMLSNCAALEIVDNMYKLIVCKSNIGQIGYGIKAHWNNNKYKEEKIIISNKFENIERLLNTN